MACPHLPSWPGSRLRLGQEAPAPQEAATIHRGAKYAPQQERCSWNQEGQQLEVMRKEEKNKKKRAEIKDWQLEEGFTSSNTSEK